MLRQILVSGMLAVAVLTADTVVLRSGRTLQGDYLGGDTRRVRVAVGDRVETIPVEDISEIRFGAAATPAAKPSAAAPGTASTKPIAPAKTAAPPKQRADILRPERVPMTGSSSAASTTPPRVASRTSRIEVPLGTEIVVRLIDDVDSERDAVGQTYRASVDEAVVVDGNIVVPRGADVTAKLVADQQAGKLSGRTVLTLDLVAVQIDGRMVDVLTSEVTTASESRTRESARNVGGGAALGAIIGAIAGGGKGAAIGAVTGAAAGGAIQVMTKGPQVRIPSETRLSFILQQPLIP